MYEKPIAACDNAIEHFSNAVTNAKAELSKMQRMAKEKESEIQICQSQLESWQEAKRILERK